MPSDRVELPHCDLLCCTACQLACRACTNFVGALPQEIYTYESLIAEIDQAAEVLHANVLCLLGGEPLVHKRLVDLMRYANDSPISDRVQVLTNGMRLHLMKPEFWAELDWLKISIYPGKTQPENVQLAKRMSAEHGFFLDFYDVAADPFRAVHGKPGGRRGHLRGLLVQDLHAQDRAWLLLALLHFAQHQPRDPEAAPGDRRHRARRPHPRSPSELPRPTRAHGVLYALLWQHRTSDRAVERGP